MQLSLFYNGDLLPDESVADLYQAMTEQAIAADRLGYAAIWLAEHHFALYGRVASPLLMLAQLSGLTRRIALGTAVLEAPFYHPLRLAEEAALLDQLSGGRLRLGLGSGARNKPSEFAQFGVALEEKNAYLGETIAILRQAFDLGRVAFDGVHLHVPEVTIDPRPQQRSEQLLWLAASDSMSGLAGQQGYGLLIPRVGDPANHHTQLQRYRAALQQQLGRVAVLRFVYVAETEREAQEQTRRTFARYAAYDLGETWDGNVGTASYRELMRRMNMIIGTPQQVIEQLLAWRRQFACDELICQLYAAGMRPDDSLRALELLAAEVAPIVL